MPLDATVSTEVVATACKTPLPGKSCWNGCRKQQHEDEVVVAMQGNRLEMEWPRLQNENEHQSPCEVLGGPFVDAKPGEEHAVHQDPRHCC